MGKREPQIILKTDERRTVLELAREGKFTAKSGGWDENRVFLEGHKLEVEVKNGRLVLTHPSGQADRTQPGAALLARRRVTPLHERFCNAVATV